MQQVTQLTNRGDTDVKNPLDTIVKSESLSDRDAGFYSGEDTDFDVQYHSPAATATETSRDSVDTKESIDSRRNKRKCGESKKSRDDDEVVKVKRVKLQSPIADIKSEPCDDECVEKLSDRVTSPLLSVKDDEIDEVATPPVAEPRPKADAASDGSARSPFRPWNADLKEATATQIPCGYLPPLVGPYQEEPLALVVEKRRRDDAGRCVTPLPMAVVRSTRLDIDERVVKDLRIGRRPQEVVRINSSSPIDSSFFNNRCASSSSTTSSSEDKRKSSHCSNSGVQLHQRNYKNMTRERRIEANARERTRVHAISAAFDTLRKCVPAYANNQKLSKLSVLRIACSYIMTLSRIAGYDYSADHSGPSVAECVESVSSTIQMEGKTRKK